AMNAVGDTVQPRVFCIPQLANLRKAGHPDFGLFEQRRKLHLDASEWPSGVAPDRGVVEAKPIDSELKEFRDSDQIKKYLAGYGLVLLTNYRDFELIGAEPSGLPRVKERFSFGLASDDFFTLARSAQRPNALNTRFEEFLRRVILHKAPL